DVQRDCDGFTRTPLAFAGAAPSGLHGRDHRSGRARPLHDYRCDDRRPVGIRSAARTGHHAADSGARLALVKALASLARGAGCGPDNRSVERAHGTYVMAGLDSVHQRSMAMRKRTTSPGGRLMDLWTAAAYLGCSYWTLRDLVLNGHIPTVRIPSPR